MTDRRRPQWPRRLLARCALLLLGLALAFGVAEVGMRLFGQNMLTPRLPLGPEVRPLDLFAAGQSQYSFDQELGWNNTPGFHQGLYQHNQAGMRADREYARSPEPGVTRLTSYGDSYTYCSEVDNAACWARRLEQIQPATEVLNFGIGSTGPDQAFLRYSRDGREWHPCAVLMGYMVENLNRLVNRYRPYYGRTTMPLAKPRFLLRDGQLVLLPNPAQTVDVLKSIDWVEANLAPDDRWYLPGTLTSTPFDVSDTVRVTRTAVYLAAKYRVLDWPLNPADVASSYILPFRQGSEAYDILLLVLTAFADRIRAEGATPVLVVMPPAEIIAEERDGRPKRYQPLLDEMQRHGVAVADVTGALAARARTVPVADLMGFQHYSPLGNEIVAEDLARQLPDLTWATCPAP